MSLYKKLRETGNGSVITTVEGITVSQFLGKEAGNTEIYPNPLLFLNYVKSLTEAEFEQLEQFFDFVKKENRIVGSLVTRTDRAERSYIFPNFLRNRGTTGVKLIMEPSIIKFLNLYMDSKIAIDFTLEDLVDEALKSE